MFITSAIVAIDDEKCVGCRRCTAVCPSEALSMDGHLAVLTDSKCVGCFKCVEACYPYSAISIKRDPQPRELKVPEADYPQPEVDDLCAKARFAPDAIVCVCTQTTAAEMAAAIVNGVHTPEELTLATGARTKCGMWCLTPTMRLLDAHGVTIDRPAADRRIYPEGSGTETAIWTIPEHVAAKYPEYRIAENIAAIENGTSPQAQLFPDIQPGRSDS
ncbi:4Fe-4S dicluster domain-containing protein [Smaragdicoccus niigatensis]|uniref:4Fe-4S dicluster domain-containing protein n=1 Tax=Smaragdicoccus niigatensis TaxID=359359 RepID=UPI00036EDEE8|nr:4Fe-4S dicluster domain-containing protein [Smaragdicoccus niigatensis]